MSSVTDMLEELNWESIESRSTKLQLTLLYKIMNGMIDIPTVCYLSFCTHQIKTHDETLPVGFLLPWYSVLFTVESLSLLYLLVIS